MRTKFAIKLERNNGNEVKYIQENVKMYYTNEILPYGIEQSPLSHSDNPAYFDTKEKAIEVFEKYGGMCKGYAASIIEFIVEE